MSVEPCAFSSGLDRSFRKMPNRNVSTEGHGRKLGSLDDQVETPTQTLNYELIKLHLEGGKCGKYEINIPFSVAKYSPFLLTLATTKIGRQIPVSENGREFEIHRKIEKRDMTVIVRYLELKHQAAATQFPSGIDLSAMKKKISFNRNAEKYMVLKEVADYLGLKELARLVDETERDSGFFAPAIQSEYRKSRVRRCSLRTSSIFSKAAGARAEFRTGPCKFCKAGCKLGARCTMSTTSLVRVNRALQQKELEIKLVAKRARNLHGLKRRSTRNSLSDDDLNSVASFATSLSKFTTKSEILSYRGKSLGVRNSGGLPDGMGGDGKTTSKRRKRLGARERKDKARSKAIIDAVKRSFRSSKFEQRIESWYGNAKQFRSSRRREEGFRPYAHIKAMDKASMEFLMDYNDELEVI